MYDALLEEFENDSADSVSNRFVANQVDEENSGLVQGATATETTNDSTDGDELLSIDDGESWSDDPVRMYLTQMGEIPLLTRQEEITLAKRIEDTRRMFRTKLLECDYVVRNAFKTLKRVYRGELPFDRTVQVSVTDRLEKEQILGRMPHNVNTLEVLLKRNQYDYFFALNKKKPKSQRREAWIRLSRRRRRTVRLIEELGLRTQRIETYIRAIEDFYKRVTDLQEKIRQSKQEKQPASERKPWVQEIRSIMMACQETPTSLGNRIHYLRSVYSKYQQAKRELSEGNLRLVVSIAKNIVTVV